jgi:hypothetical protein
VQGAHAGQPRVEGEEHVEALLGPHLAHDDAARPHAERLLDQGPQGHLAGALEPGLPGLQRHPVGMRETELEDLLRGDHPLAPRDRGGKAVQESGLAGLGAACHQDVQPRAHARLEERRRGRGQAAQLDQIGQPGRAQRVLADVDRREATRDAFEHDVQTVAVRQHRVDEGLAQVDAAPTRLQHALDELGDLGTGQDRRRQLMPALTGDEDLAGLIDPDLLDVRIIEVGLQRPESGNPRHQLSDHPLRIGHRNDLPGQAPLVVSSHRLLGDPSHQRGLLLWIHTVGADALAHTRIEQLNERAVRIGVRHDHGDPLSRVEASSGVLRSPYDAWQASLHGACGQGP